MNNLIHTRFDLAKIVRDSYIYEIECERHLYFYHHLNNSFFYPFLFPSGRLTHLIQIPLAIVTPTIAFACSCFYLTTVLARIITHRVKCLGLLSVNTTKNKDGDVKCKQRLVGVCLSTEVDKIQAGLISFESRFNLRIEGFRCINYSSSSLRARDLCLISLYSWVLLLVFYLVRRPRFFFYGCSRANDLPLFVAKILSTLGERIVTTDLHQKWIYAFSKICRQLFVIQHGNFDEGFLYSDSFKQAFKGDRHTPWLGSPIRLLTARYLGGEYLNDYLSGRFLLPDFEKCADHFNHIHIQQSPASEHLIESIRIRNLDSLFKEILKESEELPSRPIVIIYSMSTSVFLEVILIMRLRLTCSKVDVVFQPHPYQSYIPMLRLFISMIAKVNCGVGVVVEPHRAIHIIHKLSGMVADVRSRRSTYCFFEDLVAGA